MSEVNNNSVKSEVVIRNAQSLMNGINDLCRLMTDEDPGHGYITRLAKDMDQLWVDILALDSQRPKS